jgi:hypothetical protein
MTQKKCISYSLFGYGRSQFDGCFSFPSYLRSLYLNIRLARLLYPGWDIVVNTDQQTYDAFKELFDKTKDLTIRINEADKLCKMMLWRLKPVFEMEKGEYKYSHVICRDTDSPLTYRERQAVQYWIDRDKTMHAITDSVSHTIPLMGGMIGIRPAYFTMRFGSEWNDLVSSTGIDYSRKGSDQDFLNAVIYPKVANHGSDSITQHYFSGMPNTFLSDYRTCACPPIKGHEPRCINDYEVDLHADLKGSNGICGHIGAAGFYSSIFPFLHQYKDRFTDLYELEKQHPEIFHWTVDGTF